MTIIQWEEWEGTGFDEAHAWTPGNLWDEREAVLGLRRLGIDSPAGKTIELVHGYVGKFIDEDELVACNKLGVSWEDEDEWVVQESICAATFAVFVDRE